MTTLNLILTGTSLALACAVLSVIVVLRRWAFIGEGISHSGFGGAGTAWMLALLVPALDQPWFAYATVIVFCLVTGIMIAALSREGNIHTDSAIGIFMVASLAWGFLAEHIYQMQRQRSPVQWNELLVGQTGSLSGSFTVASVVLCASVLLVVIGLWREIISYTFDPLLARTSGVREGFIHYLLTILVTVVILIGVRVAGVLLVTALLVLPGATALMLGRRLSSVIGISIAVAMVGTIGGLLLSSGLWRIPPGPTIVLVMFVEFVLAYLGRRIQQLR